MESKATHLECIEYLNELLTFKGERELSDSEIHSALSMHHLEYAQSLREGRKLDDALDHVEIALYHVRQSYIASHEKGKICDLEESVPTGWDAYELTRYPFFLETDVWAEKANLYVELENWNAAYGCICHAEEMCKVATRKYYHEILNGIPFTSEEKESDVMEHIDEDGNVLIWGDYRAWITYKNVTFHKDKILKHIDTSMFNKNTPSDEFLLQYHWGFEPSENVKPIVEHWQNMIMRHDFHIFSQRQCYLILLEFYFFYWFQLSSADERTTLMTIILDCIDKAIAASSVNTELTDNTLMDPWLIHTEDGRTIYAYKKPDSVEYMEVCYWAWKEDLYQDSIFSHQQEATLSRKHAEFLDRIYFFDTKDYALACYYYTPKDMAREYRDSINKETTIDLEKYAKELLDINPAAKLNDFLDYLETVDNA